MPDIDTDVKTSLRPYIIRYLSQKYGADAVASIMTKNTYGAREAINASGRDRADELYQTLPKKEADIKKREYLYEHTRLLGKLVPDDPGATLNDIKTDTIRPGSEEEILLDRARKIEGKLFATGVHAGALSLRTERISRNISRYSGGKIKASGPVRRTCCRLRPGPS